MGGRLSIEREFYSSPPQGTERQPALFLNFNRWKPSCHGSGNDLEIKSFDNPSAVFKGNVEISSSSAEAPAIIATVQDHAMVGSPGKLSNPKGGAWFSSTPIK
jgi:hypothetical protein